MIESKYLSLSEVCKAVPPIEGRHIHASAAWRWCRRGVLARNGQRIRLEHTRFGRRVVVPHDAIQRFLDALAAADAAHFNTPIAPAAPTKIPTSPKLRAKQIAQAEAVCNRAGI